MEDYKSVIIHSEQECDTGTQQCEQWVIRR